MVIGDNLTGNVPNFYTYAGDPALDSEIVTINYSSVLSAIRPAEKAMSK